MVSIDEIDWALEELGYCVAYQEDMDRLEQIYEDLQDYWYTSPSDIHCLGIVSESDGNQYWFDVDTFISMAKYYVEENKIELLEKRVLVKDLLRKYIRTSEEVIDHNIEYYEIKCPREFLNKEEIINNDDDYIFLDNDLYLNKKMLINDINDLLIKDNFNDC